MQLQAVDTWLQAADAALFFNEHTCKQGLIYRSDEQQLNAAEAAWTWQQYGGDDATSGFSADRQCQPSLSDNQGLFG